MIKKETRGRHRLYGELTEPASTAITPGLRTALERQAAKQGWSLSRQISYACARFVAARKITDDIGLT